MHLPLTLTCLDIYNKEELDLLEISGLENSSRKGAGPDHRMEEDVLGHLS